MYHYGAVTVCRVFEEVMSSVGDYEGDHLAHRYSKSISPAELLGLGRMSTWRLSQGMEPKDKCHGDILRCLVLYIVSFIIIYINDLTQEKQH